MLKAFRQKFGRNRIEVFAASFWCGSFDPVHFPDALPTTQS